MAGAGTFRAVRFGALHRNKLPFRDLVLRILEEERRAIREPRGTRPIQYARLVDEWVKIEPPA
jgi:hypothetical protein